VHKYEPKLARLIEAVREEQDQIESASERAKTEEHEDEEAKDPLLSHSKLEGGSHNDSVLHRSHTVNYQQ